MLRPAYLYEEELRKKLWEIAYDEKYMFSEDGWTETLQLGNSTWHEHAFASVSKDNKVLGYIKYSINQRTFKAFGLCIINFSEDKITFGVDVMKAVNDIFVKYRFKKLTFDVTIGNPIEPTYDKLVRKFGDVLWEYIRRMLSYLMGSITTARCMK